MVNWGKIGEKPEIICRPNAEISAAGGEKGKERKRRHMPRSLLPGGFAAFHRMAEKRNLKNKYPIIKFVHEMLKNISNLVDNLIIEY
jgi:hypothetical protein